MGLKIESVNTICVVVAKIKTKLIIKHKMAKVLNQDYWLRDVDGEQVFDYKYENCIYRDTRFRLSKLTRPELEGIIKWLGCDLSLRKFRKGTLIQLICAHPNKIPELVL